MNPIHYHALTETYEKEARIDYPFELSKCRTRSTKFEIPDPELQETLGSLWSSWYTGLHSRPGEAVCTPMNPVLMSLYPHLTSETWNEICIFGTMTYF